MKHFRTIGLAACLMAPAFLFTPAAAQETGSFPEEVANAMWNYIFVVEDNSMGVHNLDYARALLQYGLDNL